MSHRRGGPSGPCPAPAVPDLPTRAQVYVLRHVLVAVSTVGPPGACPPSIATNNAFLFDHDLQAVRVAASSVAAPTRIGMTHLETFPNLAHQQLERHTVNKICLPLVGDLAVAGRPVTAAGPQPAAGLRIHLNLPGHTARQVARPVDRMAHSCPSAAPPCRPSQVVAAPRRSSTSGFTYHFLVVFTFVCPAHRARMWSGTPLLARKVKHDERAS